jgi:hypothetical protein
LLSLAPAGVLIIGAFVARLMPLLPEMWMRQSAFILLLSSATLFLLYAVPRAVASGKATACSPSTHRSPTASGSREHKRQHHRSKDGPSTGKGINSDTYYELIAEEASHLARNPLT